ncbi:unnamed protein product [Acanthoscelides obtectus]|uniref:Uncharacterized protein n=1 Tax=Acanthoscelides obtectus TaxID=200917 RepID=A0A9P0QD26_ACAOB|nr:unnamed protein product [Acanthoscelides obtectus]CAK1635979.1 hypothetical protein AOBTE_LOCUS9669 [Acanthoscelides obtectus]
MSPHIRCWVFPLSVRQWVGRSADNMAEELGIAQTTLWRILRRDLGLHPYQIKFPQELKRFDHMTRHILQNHC